MECRQQSREYRLRTFCCVYYTVYKAVSTVYYTVYTDILLLYNFKKQSIISNPCRWLNSSTQREQSRETLDHNIYSAQQEYNSSSSIYTAERVRCVYALFCIHRVLSVHWHTILSTVYVHRAALWYDSSHYSDNSSDSLTYTFVLLCVHSLFLKTS